MRRIVAALITLLAAPATACGVDTDCEVAGGSYRIAMPAQKAKGTILFFHGWQGTANGVMKNGSLVRRAGEAGLAVVAPQGLNKSWSFPGAPGQRRDEFAFVDAIYTDLVERHRLPADRIMVTGFSLGGSMAWNAACYRGHLFAGYAPIAGAYWDPIPQDCPSKVPVLLHIHGTKDRTVPLSGRPIGDSAHQSDVFESIDQWRRQGRCNIAEPKRYKTGQLSCARWDGCGGGVLEVCLHDGGHSIRSEWVIRGWQELAQIKGWE